MPKLLLTKEEKQARMLIFMRDLTFCIKGNQRFSFTANCSKHKLTWNVNALSTRSIMIRTDLVEPHPAVTNAYRFTEYGKSLSLAKLVEVVYNEIEGMKNHLATYVPDVDKSALPDPITEEEEIEREKSQTEVVLVEKTNGMIKHIEPVTIEPELGPKLEEQNEVDLDEVEWSIVKMGLRKVIETENELYQKLAEQVLNKLA